MNPYCYRNPEGRNFRIEVVEGDVPDGADYYGYIFKVSNLEDTVQVNYYKAIVKKKICETSSKSRIWLNTTALDFLKKILDTYSEGRTLILIPESNDWFIL